MTSAVQEVVVIPPNAGTSDSPEQRLVLTERLPPALRAPRALAIFTAVLGAIFWRLSWRPLWHTDIWGHLAYGKQVWDGGTLPAFEPLMPLAAGMPFVDTAWLSQLCGYAAYSAWGAAGLQFLFAATLTACLAILAWQLYRKTHSVAWSLLGLAAFLWVDWQQFLVGWPEAAALVRPQLAGLACFVLLFSLLVARRQRPSDWFVVPALFVLWANLHGSFVVGLGLLACFLAGRGADVFRRTGRLSCVIRDARARRLLLLTELSAAAVLLNPYGLGIYAEVLRFSSNLNLADLVEWEPLSIRSSQGQAAACIALALVVAYRLSPRRVSFTEILLLAGLGFWTLWTSRMLLWWGVPAAYWLALHGHAAWRKVLKRGAEQSPSPRSGLWSAVTVGLIWIFFAGSSFGVRVLHGKQLELRQAVSRATPVGAVEYLREHPPQGQVFNTYEWGDYLTWAGPAGIQVFVNSHAHLVPRQVWQDYLTISSGVEGWDELLERYGVSAIVVDVQRSPTLVSLLRERKLWTAAYDDGSAAIFTRGKSVPVRAPE